MSMETMYEMDTIEEIRWSS